MTAPLNDDDLEAIRQRADAATPGPWATYKMHHGATYVARLGLGGVARGTGVFWRPGDAEFIAHARQDVPALLAEVDRLRREVADVRDFLNEANFMLTACREESAVEIDRLRGLLDGMTGEGASAADDRMG